MLTTTIIATGAVVFLASAVQGVSGFGFALVALAILPVFLEMKFAVPLVGVFGWFTSMALGWQLRHDMKAARVLPLLVGGVVGAPIGATFLKEVDAAAAIGALGALLLAYTTWALLGRAPAPREFPRSVATGVGVVAGVLSGAFGTSGPPLVAYTTLTPWSRDQIKATLQAFFVFAGGLTISLYIYMGLLTSDMVQLNLLLTPALLLGVFAGARLARHVDQAAFRRLLLASLWLVGAIYVGRFAAA